MGDKPFELIITYPKLIILAIIILTACFCFGLAGITSDPDFDKFLPEDHPARVYNDTVKNTFSLGKSIFVVIDTDNPNGVFNRKSLHIIHALTDEVAAIDGVLKNTIMSIATERNIVGTEEGMTADYFMEDLPESDEEIAKLKQDVLASDLHVGNIISPDGSMASIVFDVEDDIDNLLLHDTLQELLSSYRDQENNIIVTGDPVASGLVGKYVGIDMGVIRNDADCHSCCPDHLVDYLQGLQGDVAAVFCDQHHRFMDPGLIWDHWNGHEHDLSRRSNHPDGHRRYGFDPYHFGLLP